MLFCALMQLFQIASIFCSSPRKVGYDIIHLSHKSLPRVRIVSSQSKSKHVCPQVSSLYFPDLTLFSISVTKSGANRFCNTRQTGKLRFILPCKSECQPIFQNSFQIFKIKFLFLVQSFQKHIALVYFLKTD